MSHFEEIESSQRQHHNEIQHQMKVEILTTEQQYKRFSMLKPRVFKDGNMWCVLYGDNQMDGIVGFGESIHEAIMAWECAFN